MSVDLDISHYNLQDILSLFKVPINFDEQDMKRAKAIVLKTHPDKSKLPPEYFRFYSKAYKMLYSVWEFKKKGDVNNDNKNTEYKEITYSDNEKNVLLDQFFDSNKKMKDNNKFNQWFNAQFEKNKLYNEGESKGYEQWLKSDEDVDANTDKNVTMATMAQEFDKKKTQARSLVVHQGIQEICSNTSNSAYDLSTDAPDTYDSNMFSNLQFQDLHQAHVNSVIPVTDEDYKNKQKFNNINEFIDHRNGQDIKPLSESQAMQYLTQRNNKDDESAVRRAYQLAKETEQAKQRNNDFWSGLQLLNNK